MPAKKKIETQPEDETVSHGLVAVIELFQDLNPSQLDELCSKSIPAIRAFRSEILAADDLDAIEAEMKELSKTLPGLKKNDPDTYHERYKRYLKLAEERDRIKAGQ